MKYVLINIHSQENNRFKTKQIFTKFYEESDLFCLKVFNTIIFPHFNYCCTIWSNRKNKGNIDKLYRLQKRAAKIILNEKDRYSPTSVLFRELRWMSPQTIILLETNFSF